MWPGTLDCDAVCNATAARQLCAALHHDMRDRAGRATEVACAGCRRRWLLRQRVQPGPKDCLATAWRRHRRRRTAELQQRVWQRDLTVRSLQRTDAATDAARRRVSVVGKIRCDGLHVPAGPDNAGQPCGNTCSRNGQCDARHARSAPATWARVQQCVRQRNHLCDGTCSAGRAHEFRHGVHTSPCGSMARCVMVRGNAGVAQDCGGSPPRTTSSVQHACNSGTILCSGLCSAAPPPATRDRRAATRATAAPGSATGSAARRRRRGTWSDVQQRVHSGTYQCNGQCSATAARQPGQALQCVRHGLPMQRELQRRVPPLITAPRAQRVFWRTVGAAVMQRAGRPATGTMSASLQQRLIQSTVRAGRGPRRALARRACGHRAATGTVGCDGACNAAAFPDGLRAHRPPNYGQACSNACNSGTILCNGNVSAAATGRINGRATTIAPAACPVQRACSALPHRDVRQTCANACFHGRGAMQRTCNAQAPPMDWCGLQQRLPFGTCSATPRATRRLPPRVWECVFDLMRDRDVTCAGCDAPAPPSNYRRTAATCFMGAIQCNACAGAAQPGNLDWDQQRVHQRVTAVTDVHTGPPPANLGRCVRARRAASGVFASMEAATPPPVRPNAAAIRVALWRRATTPVLGDHRLQRGVQRAAPDSHYGQPCSNACFRHLDAMRRGATRHRARRRMAWRAAMRAIRAYDCRMSDVAATERYKSVPRTPGLRGRKFVNSHSR